MSHDDYREPVPIGMRKRRKTRGPLTVSEKVDVVHKILIEHELYKDVAREYGVRIGAVYRVVKAA